MNTKDNDKMRRAILDRLLHLYETEGPDGFAEAKTLPEYQSDRKSFIICTNQLMKEELIVGKSFGEEALLTPDKGILHDRMGISLNAIKMKDVQKAIRPWYFDPKFVLATIISLLMLIIAIIAL